MESQTELSSHPTKILEAAIEKIEFPEVSKKTVIATVPSGEIRLESGADGLWLQFDCECLHALPWCKAQCCRLTGIGVAQDEAERLDKWLEWDNNLDMPVMIRDSNATCIALNDKTCTCTIYGDRPRTCQNFHCTWGAGMRGWKLPNIVHRQAR